MPVNARHGRLRSIYEMRSPPTFFRSVFAAALAGTALALCAGPGYASRPVHKTITGCVTGGVLISDNGYTIRVRQSGDRKAADLAPYEGLKIRYTGSLLPGDVFFVRGKPAILGHCRDDTTNATP